MAAWIFLIFFPYTNYTFPFLLCKFYYGTIIGLGDILKHVKASDIICGLKLLYGTVYLRTMNQLISHIRNTQIM